MSILKILSEGKIRTLCYEYGIREHGRNEVKIGWRGVAIAALGSRVLVASEWMSVEDKKGPLN